MDYLLDTNICIHYFKGQFGLQEKIKSIGFNQTNSSTLASG